MATGQAVARWLVCDAAPEGWLAALDTDERERAGRFHFASDRASYVAAHALGRAMLERFGGLPAASWRFRPGRFGKPEIDPAHDRSWLRFNLSHTRGMAACIVMRDADVGVDVEALDRKHDGAGVAERFFQPAEVRQMDRPNAFMRLWTLKESVMKATGEGLHLALNAYGMTLDPPGVRFLSGDRGPWSFHQQGAGARHLIAAAVRAPFVRFDCAQVEPGAMGAA